MFAMLVLTCAGHEDSYRSAEFGKGHVLLLPLGDFCVTVGPVLEPQDAAGMIAVHGELRCTRAALRCHKRNTLRDTLRTLRTLVAFLSPKDHLLGSLQLCTQA